MLWCFVLNPHRRSPYPNSQLELRDKLRMSSVADRKATPHWSAGAQPLHLSLIFHRLCHCFVIFVIGSVILVSASRRVSLAG